MIVKKPKWNRHKEARPAEIIDAAIDVFAEKGFAAAKLEDVARRAGIAKGTLYLYFDTEEEMFRAVVQQELAARLQEAEQAALPFFGSLADFVPMLLTRAAGRLGDSRIPAIARMVMAESRTFPDLAVVWLDQLVARMLALITGIAFWDPSGRSFRSPAVTALLAEAEALIGNLGNAGQLIDDAIAQVERPGWGERFAYAEILRLKGWILSLEGDFEGAERNFLASLD